MTQDSESPLTFPCRFPIKAMGRADDKLLSEIEAIVRRHAPDVQADDFRTSASSQGKYVSITVTITAESRAQLDAIYMELSSHELVMMAL